MMKSRVAAPFLGGALPCSSHTFLWSCFLILWLSPPWGLPRVVLTGGWHHPQAELQADPQGLPWAQTEENRTQLQLQELWGDGPSDCPCFPTSSTKLLQRLAKCSADRTCHLSDAVYQAWSVPIKCSLMWGVHVAFFPKVHTQTICLDH